MRLNLLTKFTCVCSYVHREEFAQVPSQHMPNGYNTNTQKLNMLPSPVFAIFKLSIAIL